MARLQVGDARLRVQETGSGPALVLVHGLGASLEDWEYQVPAFAAHFRVVTLDLRGFGQSTRGSGPITIARFAADVWEVLQQLGIRECALIGHSMGGAVCLQLALDHPGAVQRMVIANSVPSFRPERLGQRIEVWYRLLAMCTLGPRKLSEIAAVRMFPGSGQAHLRERTVERGQRNTRLSYLKALRALTRWSVVDRLAELRLPVLVAAAEFDYFSRADTLRFAHALPRGRLHTFRHTRHGLPLEAPEAFNAVVIKFLRGR